VRERISRSSQVTAPIRVEKAMPFNHEHLEGLSAASADDRAVLKIADIAISGVDRLE
jgi:hypothetical protein